MPDIGVSLAISYYDHVNDLLRGRVRPEGISLTTIELPVEEIFFRMLKFNEWDVSELSFAKYVALVGAGSPKFRGIPVFPSRVFRCSAFYISTRAGISSPQDLAGRRVGIPEWAQTAGIYARAYLQHQCGVKLSDIRWVQAGVNEPGRVEKVKIAPPPGISIERVADRSLSDMLASGELDAAITAREPNSFLKHDPGVARLWPNYRPLEEAYYKETGIFPIMHVIAIKAETLDRHPWIAMNLFKAFEQAKNNSVNQYLRSTTSRAPIAWCHDAAVDSQKLFGGDDAWPYGIEPNRRTLEAFLKFCLEQGVLQRPLQVEDLFARELTAFSRT